MSRVKFSHWGLGILCGLTGLLWAQRETLALPEIYVLDVGQGDCVLVRDTHANVLIDVGPDAQRRSPTAKASSALLRQLGVGRVDLLVLTHPDLDHVGGLREMARSIEIRQIVMAESFANHPWVVETRQDPNLKKTEWNFVKSGVRVRLPSWKVTLVAPPMAADSEDNSGSLFARLETGKSRMVVSGDALEPQEWWLSENLDFAADALLAGHHGSRTSCSEAWLKAVQPDTVIISCGRGNRFGHPDPVVLARIQAQGARIARTDQDGTIRMSPASDGWTFSRWPSGEPLLEKR